MKSLRQAGRQISAVAGFTVLLIGTALIVLTGPAIIVILVGLTIPAGKFVWARRIFRKVTSKLKRGGHNVEEAK